MENLDAFSKSCRSPMLWVGCHVWNHGFESVSRVRRWGYYTSTGNCPKPVPSTGSPSLDMWIGSAVLSQNLEILSFLKSFAAWSRHASREVLCIAGSVIPSTEQYKVLPPIQYQSWIGLHPKIQSGIGSTPQDPVRDS